MELGFGLPHMGPAADADTIRNVATEAEQLGYSTLWTNDRLLRAVNAKTWYPANPDGVLDPQYANHYDALAALPYVAAFTSRIRLGVSVLLLPYRDPLTVAKQVAALDQFSDGRVTLGIGIGWSEDEADATGTPYSERARMGEEGMEALRALWSDDPVEYHGQYYDIPLCEFGPKPVQQPHPPLLRGGVTPAAARRAGRTADGFIGCCVSVDLMLEFKQQFENAAKEAGRDPSQLRSIMHCMVKRTDSPITDPNRPQTYGTWEQIRDDVQRFADAGVDETFFYPYTDPHITDQRSVLEYMERLRGILDERVPG